MGKEREIRGMGWGKVLCFIGVLITAGPTAAQIGHSDTISVYWGKHLDDPTRRMIRIDFHRADTSFYFVKGRPSACWGLDIERGHFAFEGDDLVLRKKNGNVFKRFRYTRSYVHVRAPERTGWTVERLKERVVRGKELRTWPGL